LRLKPKIEGFLTHIIERGETSQLLDDLVGGSSCADSAWAELKPVGGGDFSEFFDTFFQDLNGRDSFGRSFVELLSDVCTNARAVVLSYGRVGTDIDVFQSCDEFCSCVVDDYKEAPVELNAAFVRATD
jgi:hypothetical protein